MARARYLLAAGVLVLPSAALAATSFDTGATTDSFTLTGVAPKACVLGEPGQTTLNVGELVDPASGEVATISKPPSTTINGSWCNTASTITVFATPMEAQNFVLPPPTGFTRTVNYTATVSAWTTTPATFTTNGNDLGLQLHNTPGSQIQSAPAAGTINVTIGGFASPNAGDFLVADTNYSGSITITLTPNA